MNQVTDRPDHPAIFVKARQEAWDKYAGSRLQRGLAIPGSARREGFQAGYEAGVAARNVDAVTSTFVATALARASDPASSKAAAQRMERKAGKIKDVVLTLLGCGHMTGQELAAASGIPLNSITPRFAQLRRAGLINAVGGKGGETIWALGNGVA